MKKISLLFFGLIFSLSAHQAHALIVQGKSEVHVETNTNAGDGGTVYTHIETNVNGKTETFESSKSGEADVRVTADDGQAIATVSGVQTAGPSAQPIVEKQEKKEVFQAFFDNLQNFFKNLFHFF